MNYSLKRINILFTYFILLFYFIIVLNTIYGFNLPLNLLNVVGISFPLYLNIKVYQTQKDSLINKLLIVGLISLLIGEFTIITNIRLPFTHSNSSTIFSLFYRIILLISLSLFLKKYLNRWILQVFVTNIIILGYIYYALFERFFLIYMRVTNGVNYFYVYLTLFLIIDLILWILLSILSMELGEVLNNFAAIRLSFIGLMLFTIFDFLFIYKTLAGIIVTKSYILPLQIVGIYIIGAASYMNIKQPLDTNRVYFAYLKSKKSYLFLKVLVVVFLFLVIEEDLEHYSIYLLLLVINILVNKQTYSTREREYLLIQKDALNKKLINKIQDINKMKGTLEEAVKLRTAELEQANNELRVLTEQDELTKLFNRRYFIRHIESSIKDNSENEFTILFVDIDGFKKVNDYYGHAIGDELIIYVANKLKVYSPPGSIVCRLGGDEFILKIPLSNKNEIINMMFNLRFEVRNDFYINNTLFEVFLSMGVSRYPYDALTPKELIQKADIAMYYAKGAGKGNFTFFNNHFGFLHERRLLIEREITNGLLNSEFYLEFQPIYDIEYQVVSLEALVRWNSEKLGILPPHEFITIAANSRQLEQISAFVLDESIKTIVEINELLQMNYYISINITPYEFENERFIERIVTTINKYKAKYEWVCIEITEDISLKEEQSTILKMKELQQLGIKISMDDFGVGYSSLSNIKKYPYDIIKIDREIIFGMEKETSDYQFVKSVIEVAKVYRMKVVVEGVENREIYQLLQELAVDYVQGYYLSKPIPKDEVFKLLE